MVKEKIEQLQSLKPTEIPGNGEQPVPVDVIEKAIRVVELQKDLDGLQRQALAISGAIQYIQQKITQLTKVEKE